MRRVAIALITTGLVVWGAGLVAWLFGVWVTLPPAAVRALVLTLAGLAGGILVVGGAVVGRAARRMSSRQRATLAGR